MASGRCSRRRGRADRPSAPRSRRSGTDRSPAPRCSPRTRCPPAPQSAASWLSASPLTVSAAGAGTQGVHPVGRGHRVAGHARPVPVGVRRRPGHRGLRRAGPQGAPRSARVGGPAASPHPGTALHTSRRPPLTTLPDRLDCGSTACTITVRSALTVRPGCAATASAAAPETIGVAIDVPSSEQYRLTPQPGMTPGGHGGDDALARCREVDVGVRRSPRTR